MALGFPERDGGLRRATLAPIGLLADCPTSVAAACLALEQVDARGWSSADGWGSHADASMRRRWVHDGRSRGWSRVVDQLPGMLGSGVDADEVRAGARAWMDLTVRPASAGKGSTIEVSGELDAEMYTSVRSIVRSLFVSVVRTWDPTVH